MTVITAILLAGAALAGAQTSKMASSYQDASGQTWRAVQAENGVVLVGRVTNIHLGRTCKATSPRYGVGNWEWANGGFIVTFGDIRIGFPSQEVDAGQGDRCRA